MYQIIMVARSVKRPFLGGLSWQEASRMCDRYNWEWMDENGFVWDLEIDSEDFIFEA